MEEIMNQILTIIGTFITVFSLLYAVYANRKHYKLVNYNREQAWELYRQASTVLAYFQNLEINLSNTNDKDIITNTTKGEASAQALILYSIRNIKRFEHQYNRDTIEKWQKEKKIANESHVKAFKDYVD